MYLYFKAYVKHLLKPKWMLLKLPLEFKNEKERLKMTTQTLKHILDHTKIIS